MKRGKTEGERKSEGEREREREMFGVRSSCYSES